MTCTGVPDAIPSATGSRKARNSSERCRSTVRPTTLPVATSRAASRHGPASRAGVSASTGRTTAWSGGSTRRPTTSRDTLKVPTRCGPRPFSFRMPCRPSPASPPAPDRRLRHAGPSNGLGRPAARTRLRDDAGPPDVLPEAPRVARDAFEARGVRVRKHDLLPCRFPARLSVPLLSCAA